MKIVDDERAAQADCVLCVRKSVPAMFADDLFGVCMECGEEVRFRPHAPKLPKLCSVCALKNATVDELLGGESVTTAKAADEFIAYHRAKLN